MNASTDSSAPLLVLVRRSGTALDGGDYDDLGGIHFFVTIPANELSATVTIVPIADGLVEGDETVILTIQPRTAYVIGMPAQPPSRSSGHDRGRRYNPSICCWGSG